MNASAHDGWCRYLYRYSQMGIDGHLSFTRSHEDMISGYVMIPSDIICPDMQDGWSWTVHSQSPGYPLHFTHSEGIKTYYYYGSIPLPAMNCGGLRWVFSIFRSAGALAVTVAVTQGNPPAHTLFGKAKGVDWGGGGVAVVSRHVSGREPPGD